MLRHELLASGHLTLKGKSHLCQVCLKFILTPAHPYLHDGQHQRKVHLVINFCLTWGTEMKRSPFLPGTAFVSQCDQSTTSPMTPTMGQTQVQSVVVVLGFPPALAAHSSGITHPCGPPHPPLCPSLPLTLLDVKIRSASHNAASWEWIRKRAVWDICYGHAFHGENCDF